MASRRQRKFARYSPYSTSDQLSECNNWSTSKFKEELLKNGINITSNLAKTVLKQLYLDNVKSVSDKPMRENSSSLEVVSNEVMGNNSQSSEVAEISTPERDTPRLLGNLNEVVAGLKNSMDSFNVNQVIVPGNDEERRSTNSQDNFTLYNWYGVPPRESGYGLNLASNSATTAINGVPSSSLPFMDIISPTLKKQIPVLEGRDVNLAALLMKDYETVQAANSMHIQAADLKLICQESINICL
jgi:hypothetical protein